MELPTTKNNLLFLMSIILVTLIVSLSAISYLRYSKENRGVVKRLEASEKNIRVLNNYSFDIKNSTAKIANVCIGDDLYILSSFDKDGGLVLKEDSVKCKKRILDKQNPVF